MSDGRCASGTARAVSPTGVVWLWSGSGWTGWVLRAGSTAGRRRRGVLSAVADDRGVDRAAALRRPGDGRPAASEPPGRAPDLRLDPRTGPHDVRALAEARGRGHGPASRRTAVADGAAALGAGGRCPEEADADDGLDRRGALRTQAGRGGARLQSEEAGPPVASSARGVHPGDGRLPGRALAGGSARTAEEAQEWIGELVERLRGAGAGDITVRLDKGFFSRDVVRTLERLGVSFLLRVPRHGWLSRHRGSWRFSAKGVAVFPGEDLWTATDALWDMRLLTVQTTRPIEGDGMLDFGDYEVLCQADVLTNIGGIHALTA